MQKSYYDSYKYIFLTKNSLKLIFFYPSTSLKAKQIALGMNKATLIE